MEQRKEETQGAGMIAPPNKPLDPTAETAAGRRQR
jgi:hypothetical protein